MSVVLAVANQKGGVGKTTSVINLASACARRRCRTLVIDSDPQGNATSGFGINKDEVQPTTYDVLVDRLPFQEAIRQDKLRSGLSLCPANIDLTGAEILLVGQERREYRLQEQVEAILDDYDLILIDCPPSLGLLTLNALTAADGVLVPIQAEYYALEGVRQLLTTIELVREGLNPALAIEGVFVTMVDARTQLARQVSAEVRSHFGERVFQTEIPRNVRLSEAPSHGKPIYEYDRWSKGARAYEALAKELLQRLQAKGRIKR